MGNWRRRVFDPATSSVGKPEATVHNLRDTAATFALRDGATVNQVALMLGHVHRNGQPNPTMTLRRYAGILASMEEGLEQRQQEHFVSVRSSVSETCHETPADVIPMASGR